MDCDVLCRIYAHPRGNGKINQIIRASRAAVPPKQERVGDQSPYYRKSAKTPARYRPLMRNPKDAYNSEPYIEIRMSNMPRSSFGFVFGRNPQCDVVIPSPARSCSGMHFSIIPDESGRILVRDLNSTIGTEVTYSGQGAGKRSDFQWIIGGHRHIKHMSIVVTISEGIQFRVFANHNFGCYKSKIQFTHRFLSGARPIADDLSALAIQTSSDAMAATGTYLTGSDKIQIRETLGNGKFGCATHLWDVSTGTEIVVKEPTKESIDAGFFRRERWINEIQTLGRLDHKNIIPLIRADYLPYPCLYMEFCPEGTVRENMLNFSIADTIDMLEQCLSALSYAHGMHIAHRDIKPENILVHRLNPLRIKLADFGEAKYDSDLMTFCGTVAYMAPELFERRDDGPYTNAVDIWSLGVVVSEILLGRPKVRPGPRYCDAIIMLLMAKITKCPDKLKKFLLNNMLQHNPNRRATADVCHGRVLALPVVNGDADDDEILWQADPIGGENSSFDTISFGDTKEAIMMQRPAGNSPKSSSRQDSSLEEEKQAKPSKRYRDEDILDDRSSSRAKRRLTDSFMQAVFADVTM